MRSLLLELGEVISGRNGDRTGDQPQPPAAGRRLPPAGEDYRELDGSRSLLLPHEPPKSLRERIQMDQKPASVPGSRQRGPLHDSDFIDM